MMLSSLCRAQEIPQSVTDLIAQKAKEVENGVTVDLNGKTGTCHQLWIYQLQDSSKNTIAEILNFGWEARKGEKPGGFFQLFTLNLPYLSQRALSGTWATDHVVHSSYPPLFLGMGPILPLDKEELNHYKILDKKNWRVSLTIKFDAIVKAVK